MAEMFGVGERCLASLRVREGDPVEATGVLGVDGRGVVIEPAGAPGVRVRLEGAVRAGPLPGGAVRVVGVWRDGLIGSAAVGTAPATSSSAGRAAPARWLRADTGPAFPLAEPVWWSDRSKASPTSRAFARAFDEGLVTRRRRVRLGGRFAFLVTTPDVARAEAVLRPAFGDGLGLIRAAFAVADHERAEAVVERLLASDAGDEVVTAGQATGPDQQRYEHVGVRRVTDAIVAALRPLPSGMLALDVLVRPRGWVREA